MAKAYEDFKKSYGEVQAQVSAGMTEIKKNAGAIAQTSGVMSEGVKEIGLRIQELKDAGDKGGKIEDFLWDNDVKTMYASVNSYMKQIETECNRIAGLHAGSFAKTKTLFYSTKKALADEIAARKKQVSTKLGTGNKSLPDMEKLLADMVKYQDAGFSPFEVFAPETASEHKRQLENQIKSMMSQTKDATLSAFQKEMDEQACNTRVLNGNVGKAKQWLTAAQAQLAAGDKAFKAKQLKPLMDAKLAIVPPNKSLQELTAKYDRGMADDWIRSKVNSSKDKSTILAGMKSISDMADTSKKCVEKIAAMKL